MGEREKLNRDPGDQNSTRTECSLYTVFVPLLATHVVSYLAPLLLRLVSERSYIFTRVVLTMCTCI